MRTLILVLIPILILSCKKEPFYSITKITVKSDTVLLKGNLYKLTFKIEPTNATKKKVTLSSGDDNVISFVGDTAVMAKNTGKATITASTVDGSNLSVSVTVNVYDKPQITINSVQEISYYTAKFSIDYNNGGDGNSVYGFCWDSVPTVDTMHNIGKYFATSPDKVITVDLFDPETKYYVKSFIGNKVGLIYSDSVIVHTIAQPAGLVGNYMLNIPLASGTVAKYNDWIYYSNYNDKQKLYRIKTDLTHNQKVSDAAGIYSLNIIGSYIYFIANNNIYIYGDFKRCKLDGSGLYSYDIGFSWKDRCVLVIDKMIYPSSNGYFRISTDKKELIKSWGFQGYINISNNMAYCCLREINNIDSLYTINVCNIDGSQSRELYRGYNPYFMDNNTLCLGIYGNTAFFREYNKLKKFDLNNPGVVTVLPIAVSTYNIVNNSIYFSNVDDANKLYIADLNGLSVNKLSDDKVRYISVIDNWLYYYNLTDNKLYRVKQDGSEHQLVN